MENVKEIEIHDCRHKEILKVFRVGGDLEIRVYDQHGFSNQYWSEVKKPVAKNMKKILKHFEAIKALLERQKE